MRKCILLAFALVMILPVMFLTVSCAKKEMQTEPVSTIQPEVQKTSDKSTEEEEQVRALLEDRLPPEAADREAAETAFVNENIHFEFNSSVLSDQAQRILNSKADYLRTNSDVTITVEGHCDSRGTDTYNFSLGQRRSESVKKFLVEQGISTNRLVTVSYGEKRPIALGKNKASWAKNRRAQIVVN